MYISYFKLIIFSIYSSLLLPDILQNIGKVFTESEIRELLIIVAFSTVILPILGIFEVFKLKTSIVLLVLGDIVFLIVLNISMFKLLIITYYIVFKVIGEVFLTVLKSYATSVVTKNIAPQEFSNYRQKLTLLTGIGTLIGLYSGSFELINTTLTASILTIPMIILNIGTYYFVKDTNEITNDENTN